MFWKRLELDVETETECRRGQADALALLGKSSLGSARVGRPQGGLSSLPQAGPYLPQGRGEEEREVGQEQEAFLVQWTGRP